MENKKKAAPLATGTASNNSINKSKRITKLDRIVNLLKSRTEGLNRFEAESYGDHCLNSTIAVIRCMYGDKLVQRREVVPTRYNPAGVHVNRYWIAGTEVSE